MPQYPTGGMIIAQEHWPLDWFGEFVGFSNQGKIILYCTSKKHNGYYIHRFKYWLLVVSEGKIFTNRSWGLVFNNSPLNLDSLSLWKNKSRFVKCAISVIMICFLLSFLLWTMIYFVSKIVIEMEAVNIEDS